MESNKADRRLNFHRLQSEISAYAEEYYKFNPKKERVAGEAVSKPAAK
jgi:hypothetical protein